MKIISLLCLFISLNIGFISAQYKADDILGYFYVVDPFSEEGSQILISKNSNGTYEAIVTWVENPEKKNFLGLLFLKDLKWNEKDQKWENGTIYYPGKKGTFSVNMYFTSKNTLKVRGYWAIALLGKTVYWTRESKKREQ